jgi:hypothetical protein
MNAFARGVPISRSRLAGVSRIWSRTNDKAPSALPGSLAVSHVVDCQICRHLSNRGSRASSSHLTDRWREPDSNLRSHPTASGARDPTHSNRERSSANKGRGMRSREGGNHQCTVLDQECRQGARSRDASDKGGKPVVFSVCSLVIPGLRADAVAV